MKQYVLLYPITEAEFKFSIDELKEAIQETGCDCFVTHDKKTLFITHIEPTLVARVRDEHNIKGVILGCDEFIV